MFLVIRKNSFSGHIHTGVTLQTKATFIFYVHIQLNSQECLSFFSFCFCFFLTRRVDVISFCPAPKYPSLDLSWTFGDSRTNY